MSSTPQELSSLGSSSQTGDSQQTSFVNTSLPIASKRLIICCDGTWQSSVSGLKNIPSNITRLARSIAPSGHNKDQTNNNKIYQQIVYYDAGIGTGELSKGEKDRQGGFGIGFPSSEISRILIIHSFLSIFPIPLLAFLLLQFASS